MDPSIFGGPVYPSLFSLQSPFDQAPLLADLHAVQRRLDHPMRVDLPHRRKAGPLLSIPHPSGVHAGNHHGVAADLHLDDILVDHLAVSHTTVHFRQLSSELVLNLAYLITTAVIGGATAQVSFRLRRDDFENREALKAKNVELQALDREKTKFFSNVSHELRTPLTLIIGPLELLVSGRSELTSGLLQAMMNNARRLLRQVNTILDFAKVEANKLVCRPEPGNVGRIISQFLDAARPQCTRLKIQLNASGLDKVPDSAFDHEKVETIVANLISNAIKFTPADGNILVSAESDDEKITFRVKDSGIGIPKEQLGKLFGRFFQVDDAQTRKKEGTGLGLALSRELALLHGGDIAVESESGQGTTFTVSLSRSLKSAGGSHTATPSSALEKKDVLLADLQALGPATEANLEDEVAAQNREIDQRKKNILPIVVYVDDNRDLRNYVRSLLMPTFNVYLAVDGKAGLELIRKIRPEIILSDVMMPEIDGIELCRKVKADPELRFIPVVLLTAKTAMEAKLEGLEEGADDYLNKPFSDQELIARLKNLLALRSYQLRLKAELDAARKIQESLLPQVPQVHSSATFEALYRPSEELSGDFFDVIPSRNWIYGYLADVTSHGTASAQVTYLLKTIFTHALADGASPDLSQLLGHVTQKYREFRLSYNVALQVFRFDPNALKFEFARAGSPAALLVSGQETASLGPEPFHLLSAQESSSRSGEVQTFSLQPGASVFFYSDGAYEFSQGGQDFSLVRLQRLLKTLGPSDWQGEIVSKLQEFSTDGKFADDLTILRLSIKSEATVQ